MAYYKFENKPQNILAISSARASANEENSLFRVNLNNKLTLNASKNWKICCIKCILLQCEYIQYQQRLWHKRISPPFQTTSTVFKNNFDVADLTKQQNYNSHWK